MGGVAKIEVWKKLVFQTPLEDRRSSEIRTKVLEMKIQVIGSKSSKTPRGYAQRGGFSLLRKSAALAAGLHSARRVADFLKWDAKI